MVFVASCAASRSHRDPPIAMTSTPRVTSSAKIAGARCGCPSADRRSMTIVRPSIQPRSRKPYTKARTSGETGSDPAISAGAMTAWTNATIRRRGVGWARATSGQVAALLRTVMNSRRFIASEGLAPRQIGLFYSGH
jgi:hypothetical protein